MFQKDILKEYINHSELRVFNDRIKVRLSKELAQKYDAGSYTNALNNMDKCFKMIEALPIQYPGNANPIFYVYIVPDDNYAAYLRFQAVYDQGKGGGKPVRCYDLDGFNFAYGCSQNMLEDDPAEEKDISKIANDIHELAHIVQGQFFHGNQIICEGFADALPLYVLGLEDKFDAHRTSLLHLKKEQIFSAQEILDSEKNDSFGAEAVLPDKSCSFRLSYISSYLFVRGCMEAIVKKHHISKGQSVQYFLEILKQCECANEWLIFEIADALDLSRDELLDGKQIQLDIIQALSDSMKSSAY